METTQPPTTSKRIVYVDASALKESACQRRLLYTIFYGYSRQGHNKYLNYKAGYGSAVHKALELWYSKPPEYRVTDSAKCAEAALNYYEPFTPYIPLQNAREYRSSFHLASTLGKYFELYQPESDAIIPIRGSTIGTEGMLETKFCIKYYENPDFILYLTGTIDMIASYYGQEVFCDHKSTGAYDIDEYFEDYKLSVQMQFYSWILEKHLIKRRLPCIINGLFLKKPTKKSTDFDGVILQRSQLIHYTDKQIVAFEDWLRRKLDGITQWLIHNFRHSFTPTVETTPEYSSCTGGKFGRCPYFTICSLDPDLQDSVLNGMDQVPYEPLRFSE